ncbi:hypothetical protein EAF04_003795 [Stromatinia cepivora]|nr:hypothetical protein EAF04_003795 [Stromatinia cepivora]
MERLKRIHAVEAMQRLLDDIEKFEGWQVSYKLFVSTVYKFEAEIATEKKEREKNPFSGLKNEDYRMRMVRTILPLIKITPALAGLGLKRIMRLVKWIYEEMFKKREMDGRLEIGKIKEIQQEVLEQPNEYIEAQKLKEEERLEEEARKLREKEEEMEDDEDDIEIDFFLPDVEEQCQTS